MECSVNSIISQDFTDFELILVGNERSDSSDQFCKAFASVLQLTLA